MKKQNLINLVRYHSLHDESSFRSEVYNIARDFDENGDPELAQYLLGLIRDVSILKPQDFDYSNFHFLRKDTKEVESLMLPDGLAEDILAVARSLNRPNGIHRFLFYGEPGTGKTEACRHIARLTNRVLLIVRTEEVVSSYLGQTAKNIVSLFEEIDKTVFEGSIILFDEIDSLVLDRLNNRDLREMGRATSAFLKQLDSIDESIAIIGTTNLYSHLDKALIRRFGGSISFDKYCLEDLCSLGDSFLQKSLGTTHSEKSDFKLIHKIIASCNPLPNPGELKNAIKLAVSFSDGSEYGYLKTLVKQLNPNLDLDNAVSLKERGFTLRDIEKISCFSKSAASRIILGGKENGSSKE